MRRRKYRVFVEILVKTRQTREIAQICVGVVVGEVERSHPQVSVPFFQEISRILEKIAERVEIYRDFQRVLVRNHEIS